MERLVIHSSRQKGSSKGIIEIGGDKETTPSHQGSGPPAPGSPQSKVFRSLPRNRNSVRDGCPLYPRKRTSELGREMSALFVALADMVAFRRQCQKMG